VLCVYLYSTSTGRVALDRVVRKGRLSTGHRRIGFAVICECKKNKKRTRSTRRQNKKNQSVFHWNNNFFHAVRNIKWIRNYTDVLVRKYLIFSQLYGKTTESYTCFWSQARLLTAWIINERNDDEHSSFSVLSGK